MRALLQPGLLTIRDLIVLGLISITLLGAATMTVTDNNNLTEPTPPSTVGDLPTERATP
jgi:hypothetical protein